jgi:DNA polymerase-3 subunit delta
MAMDYKAALRNIGKDVFLPVYVCYGAEKFLLEQFVNHLSERLVEADQRDLAISKYDLAETSLETVLDDAETPPFMAPTKLVLAHNAYFLTGAKETAKIDHPTDRLLHYLTNPAPFTVLLLSVDADKLDERKKLVKALKQSDACITFPLLSADELVQWVQRQAAKHEVTCAEGTVDQLILFTGPNLRALYMELQKLAMYVGKAGQISPEHVRELVVPGIEQNVFMLIEEIVKLNLDKAFAILYELLKQKEEPIKIVMLVARQFRIMLQMKELLRQGLPPGQAASQLGIHPYAAKIAAAQSKAFATERLGLILTGLAELDYQMKAGKIDKVLGLEIFLLKLAA